MSALQAMHVRNHVANCVKYPMQVIMLQRNLEQAMFLRSKAKLKTSPSWQNSCWRISIEWLNAIHRLWSTTQTSISKVYHEWKNVCLCIKTEWDWNDLYIRESTRQISAESRQATERMVDSEYVVTANVIDSQIARRAGLGPQKVLKLLGL